MNRHLTGILLGLVLAAWVASAQDASPPPSEPLKSLDEVVAGLPRHDISGTVLDPDGRPLKKADVWLYYARGEDGMRDRLAGTTKTNRKGKFFFKQAVVWEPVTESKKSETAQYSVIVRKKDELMGFQTVIEAEPLDNVTVKTNKLVLRKIRVSDADKKPVEGARVRMTSVQQKTTKDVKLPRHQRYLQLYKDNDLCSGTTNAEGRTEIYALPNSSFKVIKEGYAEGYSDGGKPVILFPGGKASGVVKLPDGTPLRGAAVWAAYHGQSLFWSNVTLTDEQGRYSFDNLPAKGFRYSWMKPEEEGEGGESSLSLAAEDLRPGTPYILKPEYTPVNPGDEIKKDLTLNRGIVLTGRVMDTTAKGPAANFLFNAYTSGAGRSLDLITKVRTGQDGKFRITVPPSVEICAYWEEDREEGNYIIDESTRSQGNQLFRQAFREDTELKDCEIKLWAVQPLKGKVVDETGKGAKAEVTIHVDVKTVTTDDNGEFSIKTAPTDRDFALYAETDKRDKAGMVMLKAGTREAVIRLEPTRKYKGRVLNTEGFPAAGLKFYVDVEVNNRGHYMIREEPTTDANGEFDLKFGCPQAAYSVFWSADNEENRDYAYGNAKFNLAALPADGVIQFEAKQYVNAILGRVTDAAIQPIAGALISVLSRDVVRDSQEIKSDKRGEFVFPHLAPGKAVLRVAAEGYKGKRVTTSTDNTDLQVQLASASEPLRQHVRLGYPDGKPATGADVNVVTSLFGEMKQEYVTKTFRTGKNGVATIAMPPARKDMQAGRTNLIVQLAGYHAVCRQMFPDEDLDLDIALETDDGSGWDCKVVDEAGQPIRGATARVMYARQEGNEISLDENSPFAYSTDGNGAVKITSFGRVPVSLMITAPGHAKSYTWFDRERSPDEKVVTLAKAATVAVKLTARNDGKPLAGMSVAVSAPRFGDHAAAKETQPGLYVADGVAPGTYEIRCGGRDSGLDKYVLAERPTIVVKAGEHCDVSLMMEEGVAVRGRAACKNPGEKLDAKKMSVVAFQDGQPVRGARIEADDGWILYLFPGKYTLKATTAGWKETSRDIEVEKGHEIEGLILEFTEKAEAMP